MTAVKRPHAETLKPSSPLAIRMRKKVDIWDAHGYFVVARGKAINAESPSKEIKREYPPDLSNIAFAQVDKCLLEMQPPISHRLFLTAVLLFQEKTSYCTTFAGC